jgi:hypothetical protein
MGWAQTLNRTMTDSETQVNMAHDFGPPFAEQIRY